MLLSYSKVSKSLFALLYWKTALLTLFCILNTEAQSQENKRFQHGIGPGLSLADFKIELIDGDEAILDINHSSLLMTSFQTWNSYQFKDNLKISFSPGFSWKGGKADYSQSEYSGVYLDLPMLIHFKTIGQLFIQSGISYSYNIAFGQTIEREEFNLTNEVANKGQWSLITGLSYGISPLIDIHINYNQAIQTIYNLDVTNFENEVIGRAALKNRSIQLSVIFKG